MTQDRPFTLSRRRVLVPRRRGVALRLPDRHEGHNDHLHTAVASDPAAVGNY